jgi:hypothetical protein
LRPALGQEQRAEGEHAEGDGDVDEEDPLPTKALGDRPADQQAGRRPDPADPAPDAERLVALGSLVEDGRQERERGRSQDRRRYPLEHAGGDQDLS